MMALISAAAEEIDEIIEFYDNISSTVKERKVVNLGWTKGVYPNREFVAAAISGNELYICRDEADNSIVAAAVMNYRVNEEYELIDWRVKTPKDKISTIHALAVSPKYWGKGYSREFLKLLLEECRRKGDIANHLDVIDTNETALKLYLDMGFELIKEIEMYYEVVGTRHFSMMEYIF